MPVNVTNTTFRAAMEGALSSPRGPINSSAILREKNVVLEKASSLLGYQNYLTQARSWKAARANGASGVERDLQTQAATALDDTREMAAAALRATNHFKQAGELDRMLDTWVAGVKASGPVQVQDLWSDLENDPHTRQVLRDRGLTDEMWTVMSENMKKVNGRIFVDNGKLAAEVNVAGQDRSRDFSFTPAATGFPRTVSELLRRGRFERAIEQFGQVGVLPLGSEFAIQETHDFELADAMLSGAVVSVQQFAQHKRKLEDTGLSTYAGNAPFLIVMGIALVAAVVGYELMDHYCPKASMSAGDKAVCIAGLVLFILGALVLAFGVLLFLGALGDKDWKQYRLFPLPVVLPQGA